jgi:hypothetical protein
MLKPHQTTIMLSSLFCIACLLTSAASAVENNPLKCILNTDRQVIECDVVADSVNVTDAVLNRGNCQSPAQILSAKIKVLKKAYRNDANKVNNELSKYIFSGKHSFGDHFVIVCEGCNVLEYTITANGKTWTWKTN